MADNECRCGIFRNDCEYHRPEPETVVGRVVVDTGPPKQPAYKWPAGTIMVCTATYFSQAFSYSCVPPKVAQ